MVEKFLCTTICSSGTNQTNFRKFLLPTIFLFFSWFEILGQNKFERSKLAGKDDIKISKNLAIYTLCFDTSQSGWRSFLRFPLKKIDHCSVFQKTAQLKAPHLTEENLWLPF